MTDNIYTALLKVYEKIGYVQKTGKNTAQNYKYAGEADLIAALRPEMHAAGIIFYCATINSAQHSTHITKRNVSGETTSETIQHHVSATFEFAFTHVPSNTKIVVAALGEGVDTGGDKASYKAMTGALKYALRQTFLIETGDDPEQDEKKEPLFKNASTRKAYGDAVIRLIDEACNQDELTQAYKDNAEKLKQMQAGHEYDVIMYDKLMQRFTRKKAQLVEEMERVKQIESELEGSELRGQ